MKILLCYNRQGMSEHSFGGIEAWMIALSEALRAQDNICDLFFFAHSPLPEHIPSGCIVHSGDLADCLKLVEQKRFDIVHAPVSDWDAGIAAVRNLPCRPRLVLTHHGYGYPAWNASNCDALVGVSAWTAQDQQKWTDLTVQVVMNGIDTCLFTPGEGRPSAAPVVAWVGRGSDMNAKRIDRLAAVAPLLKQASLRLWIADPDGPHKVLPEIAERLLPCVERWERVPRAEMPLFYQDVAASNGCVLCTSDFEGFGLAFAEAQACACPVIGPDVAGVREVISAKHGSIVYAPELAPEELSKVIVSFLADPECVAQSGSIAQQFASERFSLARMALEYMRVYENAPLARRNGMSGLRRRMQLSPLLHYKEYVRYRWTAGRSLYDSSQALKQQGEPCLAALTALASLRASPTLYVKPRRLVHLIDVLMRSAFRRRAVHA